MMSDKFLESVKEKVKDIRCEVPEEMFDTVWDNVGKRRGWRRRFGIIIAAVAASAAVLALVLTALPEDSVVPGLPGDTMLASSYPEPVAEPVTIIPPALPVPVRQPAVNQSDMSSGQPSSMTDNRPVEPEENPSQTKEAKPDVRNDKSFEKEYLAQIIEPEKSQPRHRKMHLSVSGSAPRTEKALNRDIPFHSIVAFIHKNEQEDPAVLYSGLGQFEIGGNDNNNTISYNHRMPVNLRLMASADITDRLSAEGGVSYAYHTSSAVINKSESLRQQLHFIGVPVGFRYDFLTFKHSSIYVKVGGAVEKCISGNLVNLTNNYRDKLEIKPFFWSAEASFGAQVEIVGPLFLFAESGCSYHFDNGTGTITYYGAHPLMFSLQGGLRIEL